MRKAKAFVGGPPQQHHISGCLNSKISNLPRNLSHLLSEETVESANTIIVCGLKSDHPGLIVQISNEDDLHTALRLPAAPVAQGADANASAVAFRGWLIARALATPGVTPNCQCPPQSQSTAFHHLSEKNGNVIVYGSWQVLAWAAQIQGHHPSLEMPLVLWMAGTGRGRCDMFVANQVFG